MNNKLKQIVIETHGVWAEGKNYAVMTNAGARFELCGDGYTRQQYEQCLRDLTGRPPAKEWLEGYKWFAVDSIATAALYKSKPHISGNGTEWDDHTDTYKEIECEHCCFDWTKTLMSREEAAKRDAIIDSNNQLKICNQSCRELGSGCGCDVVLDGVIHNKDADDDIQNKVAKQLLENQTSLGEEINNAIEAEGGWWELIGEDIRNPLKTDKKLELNTKYEFTTSSWNNEPISFGEIDLSIAGPIIQGQIDSLKKINKRFDGGWFRNGEAPPVGIVVDLDTDIKNTDYEVLAVHECHVWLKKDKHTHISWQVKNILPSGYDLDAIHQEALAINNCIRADDIIKQYGGKRWKDGTKSAATNMLVKMIKDGLL